MTDVVFIDSGAFVALTMSDDQYHEAAARYWDGLSPKPHRLTTNFVIGESFTLIRQRAHYRAALGFLSGTRRAETAGLMTVLWASAEWDADIHDMIARFPDQDLSYADAISLVACRRTPRVREVFGFDHHLSLTGLALVPRHTRRPIREGGEAE